MIVYAYPPPLGSVLHPRRSLQCRHDNIIERSSAMCPFWVLVQGCYSAKGSPDVVGQRIARTLSYVAILLCCESLICWGFYGKAQRLML